MKFEIHKAHKGARAGVLHTAHGSINTPVFMPVGTRASVKAMLSHNVQQISAGIILANTYHLMLKPGKDIVAQAGGLQKFMNYSGAILTDSGGFQLMSLKELVKITQQGALFRSHIDGSSHMLTPEESTNIQYALNSTITMVLDQCISYPASHKQAYEAMLLSAWWAKRSRDAFVPREGYGQFGIIQGSVYKDLRHESVGRTVENNFEGYAVGGLAVNEGQEKMFEVLDYTTLLLPTHKPRYLMGVGTPQDIIGSVKRGIDMFDCVLPTRSGRTGRVFTKHGVLNIRNNKHKQDFGPIDPTCACHTCSNFSLAYLHHLHQCGEMLAATLLTWHNLYYFFDLMQRIRAKIIAQEEIDFEA